MLAATSSGHQVTPSSPEQRTPSNLKARGGTSASGSGFFTILDLGQTTAHVDQVRFQILTADGFSTVLLEQFVDVDYIFGRAAVFEPATLALLLASLAGFAALKRRK